jgi:hypothetical protein
MSEPANTFSLWNPAVESAECRFDVRPHEFVQLNQGTESLIERFLRCLSIRGKPVGWAIEPFCSPYFAGAEPGSAYLDRYPLAWRVSVRLAHIGQARKPPREVFGPHMCGGIDPTWQETPNSWSWTECRSVVIADLPEEQWSEALRKLRNDAVFAYCQGLETSLLAAGFVQARFDLGLLKFPDDSVRIDAFVNLCRALPVSLNWATSLRSALEHNN